MILINFLECNEECKYCYVFKKGTYFSLLNEKSYETIFAIMKIEKEKYWKNNIRFFGAEPILWVNDIINLLKWLLDYQSNNTVTKIDKIYLNSNMLFPFKYLKPKIEEILDLCSKMWTEFVFITTYNGKTHSQDRNIIKEQSSMIENSIKEVLQTFPSINYINNVVITDAMIENFYDSWLSIKEYFDNIDLLFNDRLIYCNFLPLAYSMVNNDNRFEDFIQKIVKETDYIKNLKKQKDYFVEEKNQTPLFPNDIVLLYNGDISYNLATIEEAFKDNSLIELNIFNNDKEEIEEYIKETFFNKNYLLKLESHIQKQLLDFFWQEKFDKTYENYILFDKYIKSI